MHCWASSDTQHAVTNTEYINTARLCSSVLLVVLWKPLWSICTGWCYVGSKVKAMSHERVSAISQLMFSSVSTPPCFCIFPRRLSVSKCSWGRQQSLWHRVLPVAELLAVMSIYLSVIKGVVVSFLAGFLLHQLVMFQLWERRGMILLIFLILC